MATAGCTTIEVLNLANKLMLNGLHIINPHLSQRNAQDEERSA